MLGFILGFPFPYIFFINLAANTVSFAFEIYLESDYFLSSLQLPPYPAAQFPRLPWLTSTLPPYSVSFLAFRVAPQACLDLVIKKKKSQNLIYYSICQFYLSLLDFM